MKITFAIAPVAALCLALMPAAGMAQSAPQPATMGGMQAPEMLGALELGGAFSRATLPNAPVAGGFLTITNTSAEDDTLIAAHSDIARKAEIHEMAMDGGVMKMRELADGLAIPAEETVTLKPGGFHIMFMQLQRPLVEGETFDVTLVFATSGEITLPFTVGPRNADTAGHQMHGKH